MRKEQRKADRLAQEAEDERIEKEALQREEWAKRKEDEEFLQYVRDEDERRYRRVKAQRQKEMENTMCRMTLFEKCDLGVPRCCGAFTPSTRLVSISR